MVKPAGAAVHRFAEAVLKMPVRRIVALPTNGPDRHWNYRLATDSEKFLLRIENPMAIAQRKTRLREEARLLGIFSRYGLAPRLLKAGRRAGWNYIIEEWIDAPSIPRRLRKRHLKRLIKFLARVNGVPFEKYRGALLWKDDKLDIVSRRKMIEKRLRAALHVPEFREKIRKSQPRLLFGLHKLEDEIARLPKSALAPMFSYRDIGPGNILAAKPEYLAVDWEWHSVGVSDPSFSLIVLMRRFCFGPELRKFIVREYFRHRRIPNVAQLLHARELERILGEATWPLAWAARREKFPFPDKQKQKRNALRQLAKSLKELDRFSDGDLF